jgi:hypothetical protein
MRSKVLRLSRRDPSQGHPQRLLLLVSERHHTWCEPRQVAYQQLRTVTRLAGGRGDWIDGVNGVISLCHLPPTCSHKQSQQHTVHYYPVKRESGLAFFLKAKQCDATSVVSLTFSGWKKHPAPWKVTSAVGRYFLRSQINDVMIKLRSHILIFYYQFM